MSQTTQKKKGFCSITKAVCTDKFTDGEFRCCDLRDTAGVV